MRPIRPLLAVVLVGLVASSVVLTSCKDNKTTAKNNDATNTANLPAGDALLKDSAAAMHDVKTAQFKITSDGPIAGLSLRKAEGTLTREGNAKGTAEIEQSGQPVEVEFVIVGDKIYLKGPTGGYQALPLALAASVYDPSAILNPDKGIAKVLSTATNAKTEATENIDGTPTYRVAATMNAADLVTVVPGVTDPVPGKLWISTVDKKLLKAAFTLPSSGDNKGGTVTVTFSNFDAPASITAP
jgi:lipoprotein LprG